MWGELSWGEFSLGRVVLGQVVFGASCPDPVPGSQLMQTTVSMATSWKLSPVPGILGLISPVACPGAPI